MPQSEFGDVSKILSAIANEKRLCIMRMLKNGQDVDSIHQKCGFNSRPAFQKHLNVLLSECLIRRTGRNQYALTKEGELIMIETVPMLSKILPEWKKHREEALTEQATKKIEALTSVVPIDVIERAWVKMKKEKPEQ